MMTVFPPTYLVEKLIISPIIPKKVLVIAVAGSHTQTLGMVPAVQQHPLLEIDFGRSFLEETWRRTFLRRISLKLRWAKIMLVRGLCSCLIQMSQSSHPYMQMDGENNHIFAVKSDSKRKGFGLGRKRWTQIAILLINNIILDVSWLENQYCHSQITRLNYLANMSMTLTLWQCHKARNVWFCFLNSHWQMGFLKLYMCRIDNSFIYRFWWGL